MERFAKWVADSPHIAIRNWWWSWIQPKNLYSRSSRNPWNGRQSRAPRCLGLLYTTPALPALHPPHPSLESIISLNRPAGHVDDYAGALPYLHCGGEKGKPCTYFETLCLCHVTGGRNHPKGIFLMVPNLVRASSPTWLNFVSVRRIKESSSSWIFARIWTFSTTTNYIFSKFFDTTNYIFDHHKEKSNHNKKEYFRIYRITDVTDSRLELRAGRIFSKLHFTDVTDSKLELRAVQILLPPMCHTL